MRYQLRILGVGVLLLALTVSVIIAIPRGNASSFMTSTPHAVDENLWRAWNSEALFLATLSQQALSEGDVRLALYRALEGVKHYPDGVYHDENFEALITAMGYPGMERLRLWQPQATPLSGGHASISPDRRWVATWLASSSDTDIYIWDYTTGERRSVLRQNAPVGTVRWLDEGKRLLTATDSKNYGGATRLHQVRAWDITTGEQLWTIDLYDGLNSIDINASQTQVLTADRRIAMIWDAATGEQISALAGVLGDELGIYPTQVEKAVFSADAHRVLTLENASRDGLSHIQLWDVDSNELLLEIPTSARRWEDFVWSPDNRYLVAWDTDDTLQLWNLDEGLLVGSYTLLRHQSTGDTYSLQVDRAGFDPQSRYFFAVAASGELNVWAVDGNPEPVWSASEGRGWIWSAGGDTALWWGNRPDASGERNIPVIQVVNWISGEIIREITPNQQPVYVDWSSDGNLLATWEYDQAGQSGSVINVYRSNGTLVMTRPFDTYPQEMHFVDGSDSLLITLHDGTTRLYSMNPLLPLQVNDGTLWMWNWDGSRILATTGQTIQVLDAATYAPLMTITPDIAWHSMVFSPDGTQILVWNQEGVLEIYDVSSGELVTRIDASLPPIPPVEEGQNPIPATLFGAAWNANGTRIASWGNDGHIRIWDIVTGQTRHDLVIDLPTPQFGWIDAKWNPLKPNRLLTWASDGYARIWDTETGQIVREVSHGETYYIVEADGTQPGGTFAAPIAPLDALWSPDGERVLSFADNDHTTDIQGAWLMYVWSETSSNMVILPHRSNIPYSNVVIWADDQHIVMRDVQSDQIPVWIVWDANTGEELYRHADKHINWLGPGRRAGEFMVYLDHEAQLRDVATGDLLMTLPISLAGQWSPDGMRLLTGRGIVPVDLPTLISLARDTVSYNPLIEAEVEQSFVITPEFLPTEPAVLPSVTPLPSLTPVPTTTLTPTPTPNATLGAQVSRESFGNAEKLGISAPDWPMPDHDAARTRYNGAETQLKPPLLPLWMRSIKTLIPDSLTVAGNQIGLSGQWFFPGDGENAALVLSTDSGDELWHYALSAQAGGSMNVPLTFNSDTVFFGGQDDDALYAVDRQTGKLRWQLSGFTSLYGTGMAVVDNWLIVPSQITGAMMVESATGNPVWGGPARGAGSAVVHQGLIYASSNQGRTIAAYDPVTGAQVWSYTDIPDPVSWQWLVAGEDYLYFKIAPNEVAALDYSTHTVVWRVPIDTSNDLGSIGPALADGQLFVPVWETIEGGAALLALDARTGEKLWSYEQEGRGLWDVVVANGVVYALGYSRTLLAFDAASGELLWQQVLNGGRGGSELAVANGVLYVLAGDDLYAFVTAPEDYHTPAPTPIPTVTATVVTATPSAPTLEPEAAMTTMAIGVFATPAAQATALAAEQPIMFTLDLPTSGVVQGVALNHDDSRLLTWTDRGVVTLWDLMTGDDLVELKLDTTIGGANWNPSETRIGIWSYDEHDCVDNCTMTAYIVDAENGSDTFGEVLFTHTQPHDASFVPSGGVIWSPDETRILVWSNQEGAYVLDAETGQTRFFLPHDKSVWGGLWTNDGTRVITWATTGFAEGAARIWRIPERGSIDLQPEYVLQHGNVVWGAALNSDNTHVLTWALDGTAAVWDIETGRALAVFRHSDMVWHAVWLDDERVMTTSSDGTVCIWSVNPISPDEARVPDEADVQFSGDEPLIRSAISPDGQLVLSATVQDQTVIWDAHTGQERFRFEGRPADDPWQPGERYLLTINRSVTVWNAETGAQVALIVQPPPMRGARWLADGRFLTWGDNSYLTVWQFK